MKKIISMIIMVSMLLSSLGLTVVCAETYDHPVIKVYAEEYKATPSGRYKKPEGYDVYKVSYALEGVDSNQYGIMSVQAGWIVTNKENCHAKTFEMPITTGSASAKDYNGILSSLTGSTAVIGQSGVSATSATGLECFDEVKYPDGGPQETLILVDTLVYVASGTSVTYTYDASNSSIVVDDWSGDPEYELPNTVVFDITTKEGDDVSASGNVLTLGSSAPEPEPGIAPVEAVAAKAQGAALTDLNGDSVTLDADYGIAKFDTPINTALNKYYIVAKTATATSPDFLVDFSGAVEAEGNIAFYAIVKSTHGPITSLTLKAVANE